MKTPRPCEFHSIDTPHPVALRLEARVEAPNHEGTGGIIICPTCREKYGLAPHDDYGWKISQRKCMLALLEKLAKDHSLKREHDDWYVFE